MPLYEYKCPECDARSEVLQRLGEGGETLSCPQCSCVGLDKLLSRCSGQVAGSSVSSSSRALGCASGCPVAGNGFT
ncbi:zinc ribbon domain-containing protein [bacterium]|nr:zinc ribbon domain-containing protein [bacterium]